MTLRPSTKQARSSLARFFGGSVVTRGLFGRLLSRRNWPRLRRSCGESVLELADDRATGDCGADLSLQAGDGPGLVSLERLLHLHGLDDDDRVALGDQLTLLDRHLHDRALHG